MVRNVTHSGDALRVVRALLHYPIKSCRGISTESAVLDARGFVDDRRCMIVDETGRFLTQRELPRMALVVPSLAGERLTIAAPATTPITLDLQRDGDRRTVAVWADTCEAIDQGNVVAEWLSDALGRSCRLVRIADDFARRLDPTYAQPDDETGFADGYPVLLASDASLADLNGRMATPLPMNRFRPNIVMDGVAPYEEDGWSRVRIGAVTFRVVKPCARCPITTTDQETAERAKEPLRTLATYRHVPGRGVMFGQNLIHDDVGTLYVGDAVTVIA